MLVSDFLATPAPAPHDELAPAARLPEKSPAAREPSAALAAWMHAIGRCPKKERPSSRGKKDLSAKSSPGGAKRGKKPPMPGMKIFALRSGRHKYKARGMKLDAIRDKRLNKRFKLFHGTFDRVQAVDDADGVKK